MSGAPTRRLRPPLDLSVSAARRLGRTLTSGDASPRDALELVSEALADTEQG